MDLNFFDRLITLIKLPFSSFLTIELLIIFIILYIFCLYNEKRKNKIVKYGFLGLIIFFFSFTFFYFSKDILNVLEEIIKILMTIFYFPNIIFYILTVLITLGILIYNIFTVKTTKLNKIIIYTLTFLHQFLFVNFLVLAISNNISLIDTANIYQRNDMFIITYFSQIIFIIIILYKLIYHFCYIKKDKLKKDI